MKPQPRHSAQRAGLPFGRAFLALLFALFLMAPAVGTGLPTRDPATFHLHRPDGGWNGGPTTDTFGSEQVLAKRTRPLYLAGLR